MKRAFVPTALHAELTEYTSLVRVLRTSRTLDLTTHLLQHAAQQKEDADTWTSWPLIDCPVPEWTLEDEIRHLGETVTQEVVDSDSDMGSDTLSPAASNHLVFHTTAVLVHILNLLADQRPSAPASMQNRLWPMNWEDVVSLLAVGGVLNPAIIARAEKRLERIYGPSSTKAMQRLTAATSSKARVASLQALEDAHLFAIPVLPRTHRNDNKGRRHKRRVKSRAAVDTDTDTDV